MLQADVGIVFNHFNYSESSVILKVYTKEHGLVSVLKKGARKKNSRTAAAAFQALSIVSIEYYYADKRDLFTAKSVELWKPFRSLHTNVLKSSILLFINEILYKTIQHQEANEPLYTFIENFLIGMDQADFNPNVHLWFIIKLTSFLGITPDIDGYKEGYVFELAEGGFRPVRNSREDSTPETASLIKEIMGMNFAAVLGQTQESGTHMKIPTQLRRDTLQTLIEYYQIQLEGIKSINSHLVLKDLLE
jgi:DNA repair protein RecO (recombination protein O)